MPGAFTPTCSSKHLPGFIEKAEEFKAKGVDTIACVSVNDAFVMQAWGKTAGIDGKILMLADGSADFAKVTEQISHTPACFQAVHEYVLMQKALCCPGLAFGSHGRHQTIGSEEGRKAPSCSVKGVMECHDDVPLFKFHLSLP